MSNQHKGSFKRGYRKPEVSRKETWHNYGSIAQKHWPGLEKDDEALGKLFKMIHDTTRIARRRGEPNID